jgi:hypothetical protein
MLDFTTISLPSMIALLSLGGLFGKVRLLWENGDGIMMLTDNYNVEREIVKFLKTLVM